MNVIKKSYILIILIFISTSIYSDETYNFDISLGINLEYGPDTFDGGDFKFMPTLGFRYIVFKEDLSVKEKEEIEEYDGEFSLKASKHKIIDKAILLDFLIKLKFSESYEYASFITEEKSFFDLYLGLGYLMHLKKTYYLTFLGGFNIYHENSTKSFNEKNASPDFKMEYIDKSDSFLDYGIYLGFETTFMLPPKGNLDNLFSISINFTYNYKMVLGEHSLLSMLSLGYKF